MISNNGFLSETISLLQGLRQDCPLSLPLYVVQGEQHNRKYKQK